MYKVTVVGGGNGAFAAASDLALQGHQVTLLEIPKFEKNIEAVRQKGGITLNSLPSSGRPDGFAKLKLVTVDPDQGLDQAEIVLVVVPAYAQKAIAKFCAPHLKKEQAVCLMPGNLYGSIEFLRTLRQSGNRQVKAVAEAECLIYTATRGEEDVAIRGFKRGLGLSVFPSRHLEVLSPTLQELYPDLSIRKNVLATGASNPNVLLHVPMVLLNFSNIERGLDILSYHAAFTCGVAEMVAAMDEERMQLAKNGFADLLAVGEMVRAWYSEQGASGDTIFDIMTTNPLYIKSKLPKKKEHRYFTEDIPYGICPMSELLGLCGLSNRLFSSMAHLAGAAWGRDFFQEARTLAALGLNLDTNDLIRYITEGE